jgi:hypothetical protein
MNNLQNSNLNSINPFNNRKTKEKPILNYPGYSNQFMSSVNRSNVIAGGVPGGFSGSGQFSRLNLGAPLVNLHHGKKEGIVILGLQDLRPSQQAFNSSTNVTGNLTVPGGNFGVINNNVGVINNNVGVISGNVGVPSVQGGGFVSGTLPSPTGIGIVQGSGGIPSGGNGVSGGSVTSISSQPIESVGHFKFVFCFFFSHYK